MTTTTTLNQTIEKARGEAAALHAQLESAGRKTGATLAGDLNQTAAKARTLAASLRTLAQHEQIETRVHLNRAAAELDNVVADANGDAARNEAHVKQAWQATLAHARAAAQHLSQALAAARASAGAKK